MRTETKTLISACRILARDIQSDDGVANAALAEIADRLEEMEKDRKRLKGALKACIGWTYRAKDLEVSGSMQMAQLNDIEKANAAMEETK